MPGPGRSAALFVSAVLVAACAPSPSAPGSSSASSAVAAGSSASSVAPSASEEAPSNGPFHSAFYGYTLSSPDWHGTTGADVAWDGTGSPGDMDNTVDRFLGPGSEPAFGFGAPTKMTMGRFVAAFNKANAAAHPCPEMPESTTEVTISGAPGRLWIVSVELVLAVL